ncbi:MAG: PqqD family protein, partial [Planctomycetota bacterium]
SDPVVRLAAGVEVTETSGGLARIMIPRPRGRRWRFLSFIFRLGDCRILLLDETGTSVLGLINGRRRFSDLVRCLAQMHSLEDLQAGRSMAAFLGRLQSEGVIEIVPESAAGDSVTDLTE